MTVHYLPQRPDCGRIVLQSASVVPFEQRYRLTFIPSNSRPALQIFTDPQLKTVVWKRGRDYEHAASKCYLDGDVPRGWKLIGWKQA